MNEALWSLVGVFVGFLLSEGTQWIKEKFHRRGLRLALFQELVSIERMTPSKINILVQAEEHFGSAKLMPTKSVRFPRDVYSRLIVEASDILSQSERDCLHIVYERLRVVDDSMDGMEERFNTISNVHSLGQALPAVVVEVRDLNETLTQNLVLLRSVIDGKPIDVYGFGNKS